MVTQLQENCEQNKKGYFFIYCTPCYPRFHFSQMLS
jgi:hypothetical protein